MAFLLAAALLAFQPQARAQAPQPQTACAALDHALALADSLAHTATHARQRDTARMSALVHASEEAHALAVQKNLRLTAMMSKAAASATTNLRAAQNILLFRMGVRDVRAFLMEAKRYCASGQ